MENKIIKQNKENIVNNKTGFFSFSLSNITWTFVLILFSIFFVFAHMDVIPINIVDNILIYILIGPLAFLVDVFLPSIAAIKIISIIIWIYLLVCFIKFISRRIGEKYLFNSDNVVLHSVALGVIILFASISSFGLGRFSDFGFVDYLMNPLGIFLIKLIGEDSWTSSLGFFIPLVCFIAWCYFIAFLIVFVYSKIKSRLVKK